VGRRRQDSYGKRARREGFPARSVYKLEEIDRRTQLLKRGQRVLDLGCSPGSWAMYAAKKVGREGRVLGVDLKPHELDRLGANLPENVELRVGDARELDAEALGGRFDVVLSDMAPKTTGQKHLDQYRSYELYVVALEMAGRVLEPGGAFVGKIFQGAEFEAARDATRALFGKVRVVRPKATRDESYEVFLVGMGRIAEERDEPPPNV